MRVRNFILATAADKPQRKVELTHHIFGFTKEKRENNILQL